MKGSRSLENTFEVTQNSFQHLIGPLYDTVTWYKITYTDEQVAQWDFQSNAAAFVL